MRRGMKREVLDIAVVGAGPCGIAVGVAARESGLRAVLFDRGAVTDAISRFPTYTTFFSGPEKLEIAGIPFTTAGDKPSRREALRYYRKVVAYAGVEVRQYEEVTAIEGAEGEFRVHTRRMDGSTSSERARNVVIATGYFDTPRLLGVPGETLPKVIHYFADAFPYFEQDVLVVGGGNSAADAALNTWREGARVTLVHLFGELDRGVKPWVRPDIDNRIAEGSIPAFWRHRLVEIRWNEVELESLDSGVRTILPNDWVLAMTGFAPEGVLLRKLGVYAHPESGIPAHDPRTMQTEIPGVYLAGVVAAGFDANKIFIENGKLHGPAIVESVRTRCA